jgi:starch synthase
MRRRLRILYVAAECDTYAKVGGLADVSYGLPNALSLSFDKIDIRRVMPLYRDVPYNLKYKYDYSVPMGDRFQSCIVKTDPSGKNVPTYFIGNHWYFNRDNIYNYYDDGERFLFFCKAVVEMLKYIPFKPDIIYLNDWHTGFIPLLLKWSNLDIKTIFTIHNLKYQGSISDDYVKDYSPNEEDLINIGYPDTLNFMKAGILYSDYITTVSKNYREEILTSEFGEGMDKLLSEKGMKFKGILNGIDTKKYNPLNSNEIKIPYSIDTIEDKKENKHLLQEELNLPISDVPLIASITRINSEKGIDLIINALENMDKSKFQFVLLGTGNMYYEKILEGIQQKYPNSVSVNIGFDSPLAKRIYAGSDMFVMPSSYEAGGLAAVYAMRYGTIPIVHNTGGLKDTVIDFNESPTKSNGFLFNNFTNENFIQALEQAILLYNTDTWKSMIKNAMKADWSWDRVIPEYIEIFKELIPQY